MAYCFVKDASSNHSVCIDARYRGEMEILDSSCGPPEDHCVNEGGKTYSVLPWKLPLDFEMGHDMSKFQDDNWVDIPPGWQPHVAGDDFKGFVLPKVIAAHAWGTDMVIVRRDKEWTAWKTGIQGPGSAAGTRLSTHIEWIDLDTAGKRVVFRGEDTERMPSKKLEPVFRSWCGRLLIERVPFTQLLADWRSFIQVKAQAEWWNALTVAGHS